MSHAVITENDESQWHDVTGVSYHFPRKFRRLLEPCTKVIYYKGVMRNPAFLAERLSSGAHYFGTATIGRVYPDATSDKGDLFSEIQDFRRFTDAVDAKPDGQHLELVTRANYWRDGVRAISEDTYRAIVSLASIDEVESMSNTIVNDREQWIPESLASGTEGNETLRLVSTYERDPRLREAAVRIHGTSCATCGFNFALVYGQHGAGYIQVHHLQPLADGRGSRSVDPATDMEVLCANCHVMVHRYRNKSLTLDELRLIFAQNGQRADSRQSVSPTPFSTP